VSLAVPPTGPVSDSRNRSAPFAVAGTVHGNPVEVLVASLDDVLAQIAAWTEQDPAAIGCWGLRADYSVPLTFPLRHKAGVVRESQRTVHLVRLLPGAPHGATVTVLCGERLRIFAVEVLPVGAGMPCAGCLAGGMTATRGAAGQAVLPDAELPAVHS
jgi:hypothetical protein